MNTFTRDRLRAGSVLPTTRGGVLARPVPTDVLSLQGRLEGPSDGDQAGSGRTLANPVGLFRRLETSGRFHRDSGLGRIFHTGQVSLRERRQTDSLHIVVDGDRIAAHVDRVSPLGSTSGRPLRYSLRRAAAHNLAGMAQDLVQLLRGRQGDHRSELNCQWLWDATRSVPNPADLLDPTASSWSVQIEARVAGTLDQSRLRHALVSALGGSVRPGDLLVECPDNDALDQVRAGLQRSAVAASDRPPVRALLARHPGGDVLMLNVNHAAADGVGALAVLRAVAAAYAGDTEAPAIQFLASSDVPVRPASAPVSDVLAWCRKAVDRLRDVLARPARLAPHRPDIQPGHGFHHVCLPVEDSRRVVDVQRAGTSRNVLLAALHLAIGEWNLRYGTPGRRVGVLVPVDLRPPHWQERRVANLSVTARVSTSRRHRADGSAALKAVGAQTTRNKRTRTGVALIAALERAGLVALWAKQSLVVLQPLTGNRNVDTAMLADLGWLDAPPSFGPEAGEALDLWFSAPARSPNTLCIGAVTVSERLHLVFRYPHRLFGADAARTFADLYLDQLRQVAGHRG